MASYEIRDPAKGKTIETIHDLPMVDVKKVADAKTAELGIVLEVYQIKKVHMTSSITEKAFEFF